MTATTVERAWQLPAGLRAARGEAARRLDVLNEQAWRAVDPALLELARLRVATLIGYDGAWDRRVRGAGVAEEKLARLSQWPTDPAFTDAERACLAFVEQTVMDVSGVRDADVEALREHFDTDGLYNFVAAVYVVEFTQRLEMVTQALLGDPA